MKTLNKTEFKFKENFSEYSLKRKEISKLLKKNEITLKDYEEFKEIINKFIEFMIKDRKKLQETQKNLKEEHFNLFIDDLKKDLNFIDKQILLIKELN